MKVWAICFLSWALMLPTLKNPIVGYAIGTSIAVIGLYIAFVLPVILRYRAKEKFEKMARDMSAQLREEKTLNAGLMDRIKAADAKAEEAKKNEYPLPILPGAAVRNLHEKSRAEEHEKEAKEQKKNDLLDGAER